MAKPIIRYKPVATPDKVHHKMKLPGTVPAQVSAANWERITAPPTDGGPCIAVADMVQYIHNLYQP